jgi:pyruvate ferredoxin oxidoreductase delta subunit
MEKNPVIKYDSKKIPKTGDWRYMSPKVDEEKCTACGTCVKFCPEATIELTTYNRQLTTNKKAESENKKIAKVDYDFCKGCGVCAAVCPARAIIMEKIK